MTNFFPEQERSDQILVELTRFTLQPRRLPIPAECGIHKIRTKEWLPQTNVLAYYWDYGRVWHFYGIVEKDNPDQLNELERAVDKLEAGDGI